MILFILDSFCYFLRSNCNFKKYIYFFLFTLNCFHNLKYLYTLSFFYVYQI